MELSNEVRPIQINYVCDECHTGNMLRYGNLRLDSFPPQYPHECNFCGHRQNFSKIYPIIEYRNIE